MSKSIDMAYRQSLVKYAEKYGISRTGRKYKEGLLYVHPWKPLGWRGRIPGLPVSAAPRSSQPAHAEETKAHPELRCRNSRLSRAVALVAAAGLSLPPGQLVPGGALPVHDKPMKRPPPIPPNRQAFPFGQPGRSFKSSRQARR